MVYQVIEEDYPKCKVEVVRSCSTNTSNDQENLINPKEECREVQVMRCSIVKRKVRHGRPESSCSRLPSKLCVKKRCNKEQKKCYLVVKMVREVRPEEKCKMRQKRICKKTEQGCMTRVKSDYNEYSAP